MKIIGLLIFCACSQVGMNQEKPEAVFNKQSKAVIKQFVSLKKAGQLTWIAKDDEPDFSIYPVNSELKKSPSYIEIVESAKDCADLYLVDVALEKSRVAYAFCYQKAKPTLFATFVAKGGKWTLESNRGKFEVDK